MSNSEPLEIIRSGKIQWDDGEVFQALLAHVLFMKPYARETKDKTEYWESVASQLCSTSLFLKYNRVSGPNIKAKFMQIVNTQNDRSSAYFKALQNEVSFEIWMKVKKEYFDHIQSVELKKVAALKKKADADNTCLTHEAANTSSTSMDASKLLKQNSKKVIEVIIDSDSNDDEEDRPTKKNKTNRGKSFENSVDNLDNSMREYINMTCEETKNEGSHRRKMEKHNAKMMADNLQLKVSILEQDAKTNLIMSRLDEVINRLAQVAEKKKE